MPAPNLYAQFGERRGPTEESQRWLDEHPRYATDKRYRRYANGIHHEAVQMGLEAGSRLYIAYIDKEMAGEFGENHGKE